MNQADSIIDLIKVSGVSLVALAVSLTLDDLEQLLRITLLLLSIGYAAWQLRRMNKPKSKEDDR